MRAGHQTQHHFRVVLSGKIFISEFNKLAKERVILVSWYYIGRKWGGEVGHEIHPGMRPVGHHC